MAVYFVTVNNTEKRKTTQLVPCFSYFHTIPCACTKHKCPRRELRLGVGAIESKNHAI